MNTKQKNKIKDELEQIDLGLSKLYTRLKKYNTMEIQQEIYKEEEKYNVLMNKLLGV